MAPEHKFKDCWLEVKDGYYGPIEVLKSAAGFYLGRKFYDRESGGIEPGSRESGYFSDHAKADHQLNTKSWIPRVCIENEGMYKRVEILEKDPR